MRWAQPCIKDYVWLDHLQYLGVLMIHGWMPCLIGSITLLQTFRSQQTTYVGGVAEEESQFFPVYHAPVILNPGAAALDWSAMFAVFGLVAYLAMPGWRYPEIEGIWAGPVSASMLIWLRVFFFTGEAATAVYVHLFRTLKIRGVPAWAMIVGWLAFGGDVLAKMLFMIGASGIESWLAGLAGGLAMARICKMRRAERADIAAAKALANDEEKRLTAQFGSRSLRVAALGVVWALWILAVWTDFRHPWVLLLVTVGLSALQPPFFLAWRANHKLRLTLVFVTFFVVEILLLEAGFHKDVSLLHSLVALVVGYAAGIGFVYSRRLRPQQP